MLKKYTNYLREIFPLMRNSWLPACILFIAVCFFMFATPFEPIIKQTFHILFYCFSICSIVLLAKHNSNQPLFFVICTILSYMLINYLKHTYGVIYYLSPAYYNLSFLVCAGMLFFYYLPERPFFSYDTLKFIFLILLGFSLGEILSNTGIKLNFPTSTNFGIGLQFFGIFLFICAFFTMLLRASIYNNILNTGLAYAFACIAMGFYLSPQSSGFSMFFACGAFITLISIIQHIFFVVHKDVATGFGNAYSFEHKAKKLPLKYGLGIICVDDYKHLLQAFRKNEVCNIMHMISKIILSLEPEAQVFRCTPDEFIIIFPNAEKGTSYAKVDEIRRQIAASDFILSKVKKPLKITVSCSVADKKRSDSNVNSVFIRAHRVLQKTYKFTQNITSKA